MSENRELRDKAAIIRCHAKRPDRLGSRLDIGQAIFGQGFREEQISTFQDFYRYYVEELELLQTGIASKSQQGQALVVQNYEDVFQLVDILRNNMNSK